MTIAQERATMIASDGREVPMLNVPLIRKLIGWAERDEAYDNALEALRFSSWDQDTWGSTDDGMEMRAGDFLGEFVKTPNLCGTAHCQAGGAVVESNYRLIWEDADSTSTDYCVPIRWTGAFDAKGNKVYSDIRGAEAEPVADAAQRLLGFTDDEAETYFEAGNSIATLVCRANEFAAYREMEPIFFNKDGSVCDWANVDR